MTGYHNIVLDKRFSAGSTYILGFDNRVIELENGQEEVLVRYNPWGRRRYSVNRGNLDLADITALREFYMLRNGAANSFKYIDYLDSSTNDTGSSQTGSAPTAFDAPMVLVNASSRTYQCAKDYSDAVRTITRPLTKIDSTRFVAAVDGTPTVDYTLDPETGLVTFGASHAGMQSATAGFDFYTVVRFADATDQAFAVAMQSAPQVHTLPNIELIEVLEPSTVSQDYQYGGSVGFAISSDGFLTEVRGRVQVIDPLTSGLAVYLPNIEDVPLGAPIFLVANSSITNSFEIRTSDDTLVATLGVGNAVEIACSTTNNGSLRNWIVY